MNIISNWQNKDLVCACCGSTKSVKYEYSGRTYCNGCMFKIAVANSKEESSKSKEKQLATTITDAMNGRFSKKEFCDAMSREHRYLQGEFTEVCIWWLEKCAEMYEQNNYDGRNKYACEVGKQITEFLNK